MLPVFSQQGIRFVVIGSLWTGVLLGGNFFVSSSEMGIFRSPVLDLFLGRPTTNPMTMVAAVRYRNQTVGEFAINYCDTLLIMLGGGGVLVFFELERWLWYLYNDNLTEIRATEGVRAYP